MEEILTFFDETAPIILKVIGGSSEEVYNYILKKIYLKQNEYKNCTLFTEGIPLPYNNELIMLVQDSVHLMNLNNLKYEEICLTDNPAFNVKIKKAILDVLSNVLIDNNFDSQTSKENFFIKQIVWLYESIQKFDWDNKDIPLCIYYGAINQEESYFINMLNMIGVKILYLSPISDTPYLNGEIIKFNTLPYTSFNIRIANALDVLQLEETVNKNVIRTWAKEAESELNEVLYADSGVFRPWSFRKGTTYPLCIDAVKEDIDTYWDEDARFRPEFKTNDNIVYIPNFMTKINGVYFDITKYKELVNKTISKKLTVFKESVNIIGYNISEEDIYSLAFVLDDNSISPEKIKKHDIYKLDKVNIDTQNFIISKLNDFISIYSQKIDMKEVLKLIGIVINMPNEYVYLIENFDFPYKVPKLVIYIPDRSTFEMSTGLFINFLNLIGLDILIYSPTGSPSIEDYMFDNFLSIITLDEMTIDLNYRKLNEIKTKNTKSFLKKIFNL